MAIHLRRISWAFFLCLFSTALTQKSDFPDITSIEIYFYQTEVQVTDVEQQATAFATEYYDNTQLRGSVEVLASGNRVSVFYYNETNEILEVNSTNCQTWDINESEYDYQPMFYGWLNQEPLVIGPSASLWYAQDKKDKIVKLKQETIRGITCDAYRLDMIGERENVSLFYYFAASDWITPYNFKGLRVPIRVVAKGISSKYAQDKDMKVPINIVTDFAYFRPTITSWTAFQPPLGIGCPLRKATKKMPTLPKAFKFSAEVYDVVKAKQKADADIEFQQVWYDYEHKLARLDKFMRTGYVSELYDFNTGVTYSIRNDQSCVVQPLKDSFFEGYDGRLIGRVKEPDEVLGMKGTFYYMGKRRIRGMVADTFENVKKDVVYKDMDLYKLVITIYFTQEFLEVEVGGELQTRVPIFYMVTGWKNATTISIQTQYNVFGFDDVIWPDMYTTFQLDRCFPLANDRSYFVLIMNVKPDVAAKMEEDDDYTMEQLREKISKVSNISPMRLPVLRADYKLSGVFVTGLMLNRPPVLQQFWMLTQGVAVTRDPDVKNIPSAVTKEDCAYACVDEGDFPCTGFYMCDEKVCYLKSYDILDKGDGDDRTVGENCQTWLRAEFDSSNSEAFLKDALMDLEEVVMNQELNVTVRIDDKTTDIVPVQDVIIGNGPYTGADTQDKPYSIVINYAKLNVDDKTTQDMSYVDTLNDCYKSCKNAESIACASFSYCPEASNKQCLISSVLALDKATNVKDTTDDRNCFVYSLKFLDFYTAYPGHVVLTSGEDVVKGVSTVEECAKNCRLEKKNFQCRGFEFCKSEKTCVLHSKHILDMKPGEKTTTKKNTCIHYAAKYSADYYDMGYTLIDDNSDVRTEIQLEECAKICSEELKTSCKSFNYCPASGPYMTDSTCSLSIRMLNETKVPTTTKGKCHHYEKKDRVEDWGQSSKRRAPVKAGGYTSKGFTGLVIGMLALGLVVGAVGFVVYSYYKSRSSGEGMTVRFMKQGSS